MIDYDFISGVFVGLITANIVWISQITYQRYKNNQTLREYALKKENIK